MDRVKRAGFRSVELIDVLVTRVQKNPAKVVYAVK
jgi:hypothetical protein